MASEIPLIFIVIILKGDIMNWRIILKENQLKSVNQQTRNRFKIVKAFKEMWDLNPSSEEFTKYTEGLLLFPEMLYYALKNK